MEPESSLSCPQEPATGPYLEPDASSPHLPTLFSRIHYSITFPFTPKRYNYSPYRLNTWVRSFPYAWPPLQEDVE